MKSILRALVPVALCATVSASIVPTPGTQPVGPLFEHSDLVCSCRVLSTETTNEQILRPAPKLLVRRRIVATVEVKELFKPATLPNREPFVVEFEAETPDVGQPLPAVRKSETAILFLKKLPSGTYGFADLYMAAIPFSNLAQSAEGTGLTKLESALANVLLQSTTQQDQLNAMRLLQGLDTLSPRSISILVPLANSQDPEIALSSIAVLLKMKTFESVEMLKHFLEDYKGDAQPIAIPMMSLGTELSHVDDPKALPAIEALTTSKYPNIRLGAMEAIRLYRSPSTAPVLILRLDDPDREIQYIAVITLAETFGEYGEYAPSMYLFDKNPQKYVALWKEWWAQRANPS